MTFPQTPLDIQVDLMIDDAWTEITSDVYFRDEIHIKRGRANEGGQVDAGSCELTLNNRSGKYSPRNPTGTYYGKIGRNTPIRVSVNTGTTFLDLTSSSGERASTPDHASLDITGDIDVRFEGRLDDWSPYEATSLMGKWLETGDERSWRLLLYRGYVQLSWSSSGLTFGVGTMTSTERLNAAPGAQLAVRATMDVNDGAGHYIATFYTSDGIAGTWTQLGDPVVLPGSTSIHGGTAQLDVGHCLGSETPSCTGRVHAVEVRSGIGGSAVANPVFTAQAVAAPSFLDAAGRTWTPSSVTLLSNRRTRFVGEVTSWPPRWDTSGQDVYTPIEAAGILRRAGRPQPPLQSAMRRELGRPGRPNIVAYWPCETGANGTFLDSAIENAPPLTITGTPQLSSYSAWPASAPLPVHSADSAVTGLVRGYTPVDDIRLRFFVNLSKAITGTPLLASVISNGGRSYSIYIDSSGDLKLIVANTGTGATLVDSGFLAFGIGLESVEIALDLRTSSLDVDWDLTVYYLDGLSPTTGTTFSGTVSATVIGAAIAFSMGAGLDGVAFGHIAISDLLTGFDQLAAATLAQAGETAATRIARLADEEGIPAAVSGAGSEQLGTQRAASLVELWREAEKADHGLLYETRSAIAVAYRDLTSLCNQTPEAVIAYTDLQPGLDPIDDDQQVMNSVTVQRTGGASGYASLESGALSVLPPPNGVHRYPEAYTLNLHSDEQTTDHAGWLVNLGTVDENRYPVLHLALQKTTSLIPTVTELDCGSRIQVTDPPLSKLPPATIDQLIMGYNEVLHQFAWDLKFNCMPALPYTVAVLDDDDLGRLDTDGSTLVAAVSSSATSLVVHTTQAEVGRIPVWSEDAADYSFDLQMGGEVVTATACAPLAADTFTRTVAAGGWGTASDGHTYTLTGGVSNNERSVASNRGLVTVSASQTLHRQQTVAETCTDCDVRVQMAVSATATGGTLNGCVLLRWTSSTAHYRARVEFLTGGTVSVSVTTGATIIGSNAATGLSYTPGATFEVRVRIIGYRILMRVWATGTVEPEVWHIDRTDVSSTNPSGVVGLSAHGATGNTNVGVEYRYDNFAIETPQRMTVTRSVNGVIKAQSAGEDISLAHPSILAL
ncbi:hypothetical protein OG592_26960 [Streptomyces avidinii]|uniref:hypothetical protein n=1 Tax=Streptomyces avidinii TaxID=1895 RepID=UPI003864AEE3|nr:hypothetical protein OG592_26960 [Streptomyces avidinii]